MHGDRTRKGTTATKANAHLRLLQAVRKSRARKEEVGTAHSSEQDQTPSQCHDQHRERRLGRDPAGVHSLIGQGDVVTYLQMCSEGGCSS